MEKQQRITGLEPTGAALVVAQCQLPALFGPEVSSLVPNPGSFAVVLVPNTEVGERLAGSLRFFLGNDRQGATPAVPVATFFGPEVLPFEALSPAPVVSANRIHALTTVRNAVRAVVLVTPEAVLQRLVPATCFDRMILRVSRGQPIAWSALVEGLDRGGYLRSSIVEEVGQSAVRGAVIDFFPPGSFFPIRIEYFGDRIESIRAFEPGSQRSQHEVEEIIIPPAREWYVHSEGPADEVASLDEMAARIRARAIDLGLPMSAAKQVEEALRNSLPLPGLEQLLPLLIPSTETFWDYFLEAPTVYLFDEPAVLAAADDFSSLVEGRGDQAREEGRIFPEPQQAYVSADDFAAFIRRRTSVHFDPVRIYRTVFDDSAESAKHSPEDFSPADLGIFSLTKLRSQLQLSRRQNRPFLPLIEEIRDSQSSGFAVGIVVSHPSRVKRLEELLRGYDVEAELLSQPFLEWLSRAPKSTRRLVLFVGDLAAGIKATRLGVMLIPDTEIFPELAARKDSSASRSVRKFLGSLSQLKEGDYIVHTEHGIGTYLGLKQVTIDGKVADFLYLEYAEGAKLYIPVENIGKIQKYAGADGKRPALSRLGGNSWSATKAKVRQNIAELAGQLIQVIAEREINTAPSFGALSSEDESFADRFPFDETPDQAQAIADVLVDLDRGRPMDRLVCGDVGYGKTEVALRAAFKVASTGAQVAVLVPTTVLADQHYETFVNRFADTPIRIGLVSRFRSAAENKATLAAVAAGQIEIVIGTHRLLQRDVEFAHLGLAIIDEEHRFGVAHKERLKRLRSSVHVLTLTATPIPRTLHMSMVGIKELSIIETAPANRQVIRTYLANYSDTIVREAILRELGRNGQVFYIHNRVENIALVADEIAALVPQARVQFAHGQMKDTELEQIMHQFQQGVIDVLVSTTIVESGLDIANANTIIIRDANRFGLAELYQLRGRVGRSSRRAYAYLLIPDAKTLGADAKKRLEVLQALDDLGIGFRLALQDMEIRGAGNLLGKDQSGHINLVGFELYSRILKEVVEELQQKRDRGLGSERDEQLVSDPEMKIGFPAHIPPEYIPDVGERLLLYQRLIEIADEAEGQRLLEEIEDRFGSIGEEVTMLVQLMVFRSFLKRAGITLAVFRGNELSIAFHPRVVVSTDKVLSVVAASPGKLRLSPSGSMSISIEPGTVQSPSDLLEALSDLLADLGKMPIRPPVA